MGVSAQNYTAQGNKYAGKRALYGDSTNWSRSCFRMEIHVTFVSMAALLKSKFSYSQSVIFATKFANSKLTNWRPNLVQHELCLAVLKPNTQLLFSD